MTRKVLEWAERNGLTLFAGLESCEAPRVLGIGTPSSVRCSNFIRFLGLSFDSDTDPIGFGENEFFQFHPHFQDWELIKNEICNFLGEGLDEKSLPHPGKIADPLRDFGIIDGAGKGIIVRKIHHGESEVSAESLSEFALLLRHTNAAGELEAADEDLIGHEITLTDDGQISKLEFQEQGPDSF